MTLRILAMVEIICYNAVRQNVKGVHGDNRVGEIFSPLSHHRTCRSAYGGST